MMIRLAATAGAAALVGVLAVPGGAVAQADPAARNLVLSAVRPAAAPSQRLALVIGNSAYKDAPLANPANDARAMAKALDLAGFTVLLHTDVTQRGLLDAVREFGTRLRQGGVGVFYFAGHGMQIKGRNFLIPVGADIQREDEVAYAAMDAQAVLDKMEAAGNGANLMILDACRNNPFARSFRSSTQGLAQMDAPVGTLVAFATSPGAVASDGQGQNGLYTQHLLTAMRKPGAKVEDVFKQVRAAVRRDSQGKQIPWEATSLEGDLFFIEPPAPAAPVKPPPPPNPEAELDQALWAAVKDSREPMQLRAYLNRFPAGRFAELARRLAAQIEAAQRPVAPAIALAAVPAAPPSPAVGLQPGVNGSRWDVASVTDARRRLMEQVLPAPASPVPADPAGDPVARLLDDATRRNPRQQANSARLGADPATTAAAPRADAARAGALAASDLWTFKVIDRWGDKGGELTSMQIGSVDARGVPFFVGDDKPQSPITRFVRQLQSPKAHGFELPLPHQVWWADMKPGDARRITLVGEHRRSDGKWVKKDSVITLKRLGTERVKVPAGEFDAIRLDARGVDEFVSVAGRAVEQHWSLSVWYVVDLHGFAATEVEVREAGGSMLEIKRRNELLRFEPGAAAVAAR